MTSSEKRELLDYADKMEREARLRAGFNRGVRDFWPKTPAEEERIVELIRKAVREAADVTKPSTLNSQPSTGL